MKLATLALLTSSFLACAPCLAQEAAPAPQPTATPAAPEFAKMKTSMGELIIELNRAKAPLTVENFVTYVKDGFYNGTIFHRVVPGFVIQGGGFSPDLVQKPTRPGVKNEWQNGLKNSRGTLSMARQGYKPDSGTSQFFINLKDNAMLDSARDGAAYAVFATVVSGMDVVDAIAKVETGISNNLSDVPKTAVVIESVEMISAADADAAIKAKKEAVPTPLPDPATARSGADAGTAPAKPE